MGNEHSYIIEADRNVRERHSVRQLFRISLCQEKIFGALEVPFFSWWVLDFDTQWFGRKPGDIDILGGPLAWRDLGALTPIRERLHTQYPNLPGPFLNQEAFRIMAQQDQIEWPPTTDHLGGAEVKCAFFKDLQPYSAKHTDEDRESIRDQVEGLLLMGVDRVLLVDVIANEPASGHDGAAWMQALTLADASLTAMGGVLNARLPKESPAGHLALPIGAVVGGDEAIRGALPYQLLRDTRANPHRHGDDTSAQQHRRKLANKIDAFLSRQTRPRTYPAVFVCCKICQPERVHALDDMACPLTPKRSTEPS
jgi:hypothetical protein